MAYGKSAITHPDSTNEKVLQIESVSFFYTTSFSSRFLTTSLSSLSYIWTTLA